MSRNQTNVDFPSVSVVINTINRANLLRDSIIGLLALDYPNFEIIVINGPSTDHTEEVISEFAGKIKHGNCQVPNLSVSRNEGIAMSAGDIVAFIDDDAVPHPTWLTYLVKHYRLPETGGAGGFTIDNTGVRWQVKKTICDRYGAAFFVSDFFDERPLNRPLSPLYPSLLGTNSSFRRSVLLQIGGFDDTFAYFLDETDVCLRIVDAGYHIVYEPKAVIFHQAAGSDRRGADHVPRTLLPSVTSKSYFIMRHGARQSAEEAGRKLQSYRTEIINANNWLGDNGKISELHRRSLNDDVVRGVASGSQRALTKESGSSMGDLKPGEPSAFKGVRQSGDKLRIVLVSKTYPPNVDAGIARWTSMIGKGLAKRGHQVHIVTETVGNADEKIRFEDGLWMHNVKPASKGTEGVALAFSIPPNIASWSKRVWQEVEFIKSFGPVVVSFPIWDLEGIACLGDPAIGLVMSLHTSYAMAKPFKPEWSQRPIYECLMVNRMISAERNALLKVPVIMANSQAIIDDLEAAYGIEFQERVVLAPHGTQDLLEGDPSARTVPTDRLRVLYVGRHEKRKGFDIALRAVAIVLEQADIEFWFVGGVLTEAEQLEIESLVGPDIWEDGRVQFFGVTDRLTLEDLYRSCDIVMMPSRYESFGLVAIEGMSAAKPVIALASGGLKEVVTDGEDGYLIEDTEAADAEIADRILRINASKPLYRRLSKGARASYEKKFSIEFMIDKVEIAYRQAAPSAYRMKEAV